MVQNLPAAPTADELVTQPLFIFYTFCLWIMDWKLDCDFSSAAIYHCSSPFYSFSRRLVFVFGRCYRHKYDCLNHIEWLLWFNLHHWLNMVEILAFAFSLWSFTNFNCRKFILIYIQRKFNQILYLWLLIVVDFLV